MKTKTFFLFLLILSFISFRCNKSNNNDIDNSSNLDYTHYNISAKTHQLVILSLESERIKQDEYKIQLDSDILEISKINDTAVAFYVPQSIIGEYNFVVKEMLLEVTLFVTETILNKSPDDIVVDLTNKFLNFKVSQNDTTANGYFLENAIDQYTTYVENATQEEKRSIALFYMANKHYFDEILNTNLSNKSELNSQESSIPKFAAAVISMGAGVALAWKGKGIADRVVGATLAIAGAYIAYKYLNKVWEEPILFIESKINKWTDELRNSSLIFTKNTELLCFIESAKRAIISSDISNENSNIKKKFFTFTIFGTSIINLNDAIKWINENVPLVNFDLLEIPTIQLGTPLVEMPLVEEDFNKLSFSTNNSKIKITKSTFKGNGKVALTLTADDDLDLTNPVNFNLLLNYVDDYNKLEQSYLASIVNLSDISISHVDSYPPYCYKYNDGTIRIFTNNESSNTKYSIDGGLSFQDSNLFENLGPGTYTPAVKDYDTIVKGEEIVFPNLQPLNISFDSITCSIYPYDLGKFYVSTTGGVDGDSSFGAYLLKVGFDFDADQYDAETYVWGGVYGELGNGSRKYLNKYSGTTVCNGCLVTLTFVTNHCNDTIVISKYQESIQ